MMRTSDCWDQRSDPNGPGAPRPPIDDPPPDPPSPAPIPPEPGAPPMPIDTAPVAETLLCVA
jgi:hypothetical protein